MYESGTVCGVPTAPGATIALKVSLYFIWVDIFHDFLAPNGLASARWSMDDGAKHGTMLQTRITTAPSYAQFLGFC